jgi:hypothetical protein
MIDKVIDSLNEAFESDPMAMTLLMRNKVECNEAFADHPTIQVAVEELDEEKFMVGALGLVNGVLTSAGLPRVAIRLSDDPDENGNCKLLGFCRYEGEEEEEDNA